MPVTLTVDGQEVTVPDGSTILDAARKAGIYIPTLCFDTFPQAIRGVPHVRRRRGTSAEAAFFV